MLNTDFLNLVYFNNSIQNYLISFSLFIGLFIVFRFFRIIIIDKLKVLFEKTKNDFDDLIIDLISGVSKFFYWFISFFIALKLLNISENFYYFLDKIFIILVTYEIVILLSEMVNYFVKKLSERKDNSSKVAFYAIGKIVKWIIWIGAILTILSNFGVNITALAAGLGVGGIAIAFAFQSILKDLFSYFTILLDKPIKIGDYIYIGDKKGKVQSIGVKTTRLEAVDGEEIIIANDLITGTDFRNFGKTKHRRIVYNIGVAYDTPVKKLKKLKEKLIKIFESFGEEKVILHRCHLRSLSESSMDYEIVFHIPVRDYDLYMDINEEINLKILELFEKEKVEIPFPTRTIYNRGG